MNEARRVVVTVFVSVVASAVVCLLLAPPPPAPSHHDVDWSRLDVLAARVQELERSPAAAQTTLPPPPAPAVAVPQAEVHEAKRIEVLPADQWPAATARIDDLDARLLRVERGLGAVAEQPPVEFPTKEDAARSIVDPAADVQKKLRAHEALRSVEDAYSPAMVAELLRIGTMNPDGQVRADVWRFFDGKSKVPTIVAPLVAALQTDTDARAREEAADTLGSYLHDPVVEPALQRASAADASDRVRAKAQRTLKSRRSFAPVDELR